MRLRTLLPQLTPIKKAVKNGLEKIQKTIKAVELDSAAFLRPKGVDNLNKYFTANDAEQFVFYRIPKALITGKEYRSISTDAKLLYGLLLDRVGLSARNEWIDEQDRVG